MSSTRIHVCCMNIAVKDFLFNKIYVNNGQGQHDVAGANMIHVPGKNDTIVSF